MTVMGPGGLRRAAELCVNKSCYALKKLTETGAFRQVFNAPFFREFAVRCGSKVDDINGKLLEKGIIGGLDLGKYYPELKDCWLVAVTEKRTACEIDKLAEAAGEVCGNG